MNRNRKSKVRPVLGFVFLLVAASAALLLWTRGSDSVTGAVSAVREVSVEAATAAKVKTALALSKRVSAFDLDVESEGRVVTLRGQVPSNEIADLAIAIAAETAGVEQVRDQITVDPETEADPEIARMADRVVDLEIKAAIQEALLQDPELREAEIAVAVEEGDIRLSGIAQSAEQRYRAELVARSVAGSAPLDNSIVLPEAQGDADRDQLLAERVEFALYTSRAFDLERIDVSSDDGTVELVGTVRSKAEVLLAETLAAEVDGVASVQNSLHVEAPAEHTGGKTEGTLLR